MQRKAVIVLGMHRSGTSTTSGILSKLGLELGKSLMDGNESNPKGFFENYRIMLFNESLLHFLNVNWHNTQVLEDMWWERKDLGPKMAQLKALILDDYSKEGTLLFKDPRLCILLPLYLQVLKELNIVPGFLITIRDPCAIAKSLRKRDHFSHHKSFRIWMDHMLRCEKFTREYPRLFVDYSEVLGQPMNVLHRVVKKLSLDYPITGGLEDQVRNFVEPTLDHSSVNGQIPWDPDFDTESVYILFKELTTNNFNDHIREKFDKYYEGFFSRYTLTRYPLISVLTVGDSGPDLLKRSIFSVAGQDYPNIEYLLVVTDISEPIKMFLQDYEYLLSRWFSIMGKDHYAAMNYGIVKASGEYITFLKAGDTYAHAGALQELRLIANPDTGLVYSDSEINGNKSRNVMPSDLAQSFVMGKGISISAALFKTIILRNHPFNSEYRYFPEFGLVSALLNEGCHFAYCPQIIVNCPQSAKEVNTVQAAVEKNAIIKKYSNPSFFQKLYQYWLIIRSVVSSLF